MLYVSSSKTLSFKATATGKPNSKESKEVRETPTRKQSIKSVALKRGSGGDKENLCNGVQLSKLVTREFDSNSPAKDLPLSAVKKEGLFGFKINKNSRSREDCNRSVVQPISATVDLKAHMAGKSTKGSLDEKSIKLKIHLREDNKGSFDSKRKMSANVVSSMDGPNCLNHSDKKVLFLDMQAKYELVSESQPVYCCSKCAIAMAAKGHKVKEIALGKTSVINRAEVLEGFLNKIEELTPKMRELISSLQRQRLEVSTIFDREFDRHNRYYQTLASLLDGMKKEGEHTLKEHREKVLKDLGLLENAVKQHLDDTLFMQQDVVPNIDVLMSGGTARLVDERFSSIMGIYNQSLANYENRIKDIGDYRPSLPTLEKDIADKLQSCIESIPYFKLEIRMDHDNCTESTVQDRPLDTEEHPPAQHQHTLPVPDHRAGNHMYFSFEGPAYTLRSAEKHSTSKSKSQPKSSTKKELPQLSGSGHQKHLAGSNSRKPFVSLFSDEPIAQGSSSPSFKAM